MKTTDALHHPGQLTRQIVDSLSRGERVALATLIARSGSGPREAGASMLVAEDGRALGTVRPVPSGGCRARLLAEYAGGHGQAGPQPSRISRTRRISCSTVNGFSTKPVWGGMTPSTAIAFSV